MTFKMAASTKISSVFRPNLFKGKVAVVTGGGTGIGKAITEELLFLGCKVMIASRNVERLTKSAELMKSQISPNSHGELAHMQCNIRQEDQVKSLMSSTLKRFGKIDFLVNNGGGQFPSPAADIRLKGWNAVIDTNLTGTFLCCKEAYQQWMGENGGVIVNIIADMFKGFPGMSHTGAARAAVDNLTKSLAIEWADHGVRVNAVAPGSSIYSDTAAANYGSPDIFDSHIPYIPAKRLGKVEEGIIYSDTAQANYSTPEFFNTFIVKVPAKRLGRVEEVNDQYCALCDTLLKGPIYHEIAAAHYGKNEMYTKQPTINPAKRYGTVEEVSSAVCYLLCPAASYISGATLRVDAGSSLYSTMWNVQDHNKIPAYSWETDNVNNDDDDSGGTKSKL